jgi:hypothetical protein
MSCSSSVPHEIDDAIEIAEKIEILRSADVVGDGLRVADRRWAEVGFCIDG